MIQTVHKEHTSKATILNNPRQDDDMKEFNKYFLKYCLENLFVNAGKKKRICCDISHTEPSKAKPHIPLCAWCADFYEL